MCFKVNELGVSTVLHVCLLFCKCRQLQSLNTISTVSVAAQMDFIWKLSLGQMPDLSLAWPLEPIPVRRPCKELCCRTYCHIQRLRTGLRHLKQVSACPQTSQFYMFLMLWNKVELMNQSLYPRRHGNTQIPHCHAYACFTFTNRKRKWEFLYQKNGILLWIPPLKV